jgi:hypothetical protein
MEKGDIIFMCRYGFPNTENKNKKFRSNKVSSKFEVYECLVFIANPSSEL